MGVKSKEQRSWGERKERRMRQSGSFSGFGGWRAELISPDFLFGVFLQLCTSSTHLKLVPQVKPAIPGIQWNQRSDNKTHFSFLTVLVDPLEGLLSA